MRVPTYRKTIFSYTASVRACRKCGHFSRVNASARPCQHSLPVFLYCMLYTCNCVVLRCGFELAITSIWYSVYAKVLWTLVCQALLKRYVRLQIKRVINFVLISMIHWTTSRFHTVSANRTNGGDHKAEQRVVLINFTFVSSSDTGGRKVAVQQPV